MLRVLRLRASVSLGTALPLRPRFLQANWAYLIDSRTPKQGAGTDDKNIPVYYKYQAHTIVYTPEYYISACGMQCVFACNIVSPSKSKLDTMVSPLHTYILYIQLTRGMHARPHPSQGCSKNVIILTGAIPTAVWNVVTIPSRSLCQLPGGGQDQ